MEERIQKELSREEKIRIARSQYGTNNGYRREMGRAKQKNMERKHRYLGFQVRLFLAAGIFLFFFVVQRANLTLPYVDQNKVFKILAADKGLDGLEDEVMEVFQRLQELY